GHLVTRLVHGAAVTSAAARERCEAERIVEVNLVGTLRALTAARRHAVRRVLYLSSGAVYGDNAFDRESLDEDADLPVPDTLYAITKYAAERSVLRCAGLWGIDVLVARLGSVFGRWEYDTGLRDTLSA